MAQPLVALSALLLHVSAPPPAAAQPDEIVVRAIKGKCRIQLDDRILTEKEFAIFAGEWAAGRPVTVIEPRGANYKCLAKIMFRLSDKGINVVRFVDPPPRP